jgi:hypothetical protein
MVFQCRDERQLALDPLVHAFDQPRTRYQTGTPLGNIELGLKQRVSSDCMSNHRRIIRKDFGIVFLRLALRQKNTLPSLPKELGKLTFAADGQLVAAESNSQALLEEKANDD